MKIKQVKVKAGDLLFDHFINQVVAVVDIAKPYLFVQAVDYHRPIQAYPWWTTDAYRFFTLDGKPVGDNN